MLSRKTIVMYGTKLCSTRSRSKWYGILSITKHVKKNKRKLLYREYFAKNAFDKITYSQRRLVPNYLHGVHRIINNEISY